jgi:protein FrlC
MMKISTATSVFINYLLPDAVDAIATLEIDGIDFWCGRPHLFRKDYSYSEIQRLRKKMEDNHLSAAACMPAFFRYPFSLSSPNPIVRRDSISYMKACIYNAVLLGCPYVLVVPSSSLHGQTTENARELYIDSMRKVCAYAEQKKMKLGIEIVYPRLSDYMCSTADALDVIRKLGSANLGVVLDSGHLNLSGEDLESAVKNVSDVLLGVHINDNDHVQQQNAIPGEGDFNFKEFLRILKQYGYDGFLSFELGFPYTPDPLKALRESILRLREYIHAN